MSDHCSVVGGMGMYVYTPPTKSVLWHGPPPGYRMFLLNIVCRWKRLMPNYCPVVGGMSMVPLEAISACQGMVLRRALKTSRRFKVGSVAVGPGRSALDEPFQ